MRAAEHDGDHVPAGGRGAAGAVRAERAGAVLVRAGPGGGDGAGHRRARRAARRAARRRRAAREWLLLWPPFCGLAAAGSAGKNSVFGSKFLLSKKCRGGILVGFPLYRCLCVLYPSLLYFFICAYLILLLFYKLLAFCQAKPSSFLPFFFI